MGFLSSLCSSDDRAVDSIIVAGTVCVLALIFFTGWDELYAKHEFSPVAFAGAAATIIGATAAAKAGRDKLAPPSQPVK